MREIGNCEKHPTMVIYEKANGEILNTCALCSPPPKPVKKKAAKKKAAKKKAKKREPQRLAAYHNTPTKKGVHYCSDATLERLRSIGVKIRFEVPNWAWDEFAKDYCCSTDVQPHQGMQGISVLKAESREEKRWYSVKIYIPEWDDDYEFAEEYLARLKTRKNTRGFVLCSIHFEGFLLANGFQAGANYPE